MTLNQTLSVLNIIDRLGNVKLPIRTSYKIAKLAARLTEDQNFMRTRYQEIINKYAIPESVTANGFEAKEEFKEIATQELNELFNCPVDDIAITFTLDELEQLSLTPAEVNALMPLIEE
jgi:hypothetical protein